jgi:hypothetical protein
MSQYAHQRNRTYGWQFGVDAAGHFGSALTAHNAGWNQDHNLLEPDAEVGVTE